ncbi:hypothetical protein N9N32_00020 [Alphaproteobacteria bacterium]|nr:hypothetical protein [Alphaproteobacteria bacterium]
MSIRIQRNENANAITFVGSSQPAYWNNCLAGEVNDTDNTRVNVLNTVRTTDVDSPVYEFFAVPYTEFRTALGTTFTDAAECAAYITEQANATAIGIIEFGATDIVDFSRDATNTTILASTGHSYPVNSIKAVAEADGTISIKENVDDGTDVMRTIRKQNVTFGGQVQAQQLTPVVNALNSLFTVTPVGLGAEDRFISNSYETSLPSVATFGDVTITNNVATKGINTGSEFNDGFYTTSEPVSANGEYFQFDNTGNDPLKKMMIGLMKTSEITSSAVLEDNTVTGEDMDLAVRLKPNATYEHSPYGAVIENGFFSNPQRSDEYRAGIDNDGRLFISHFDDQASEWQVIVRSALVTANEEYSLVIFLKNENAACSTAVTTKTIYTGPVMTYYYIESPDGDFYYPLFQTEAEANQADLNNGGTGTNHSHYFVDETPSSQQWFMPSTGGTHAGSSAPSNTADITYNVISTGPDANYAPAAFTISDLTVAENTAVNYQIAPTGMSFTTSVSGLPSGLSLSGTNIVGTSQDIAGYADVTPSVTTLITVTRTNSFGSTSATFDFIVTNTAAPATAITGFTHISGSTNLIDSDTLDDGSAVTLDNTIDNGNRIKITDAWITANVLPNLTASEDKIFIGFAPTPTTGWSGISAGDFNCGFRFQYNSSTSVSITPMLSGTSTGSTAIITYTSNIGYDFYISNKDGVCEATYNASSTDKSTEQTPADGGIWDVTTSAVNTGVTESKTVVIAALNTTADIELSGISEHTLPAASSILTSWDKAADFSGSNERLTQISTSSNHNALRMAGASSTVPAHSTDASKTSNSTAARPWATAIVFKSNGNNSNQHIWNSGEGTATGNDNIFVRQAASGDIYFAWGREGSGYNECKIGTGFNTGGQQWFGLYIAHKGERYSGSNATAANLASAFDIRFMQHNYSTNQWEILTGGLADSVGNRSTTNNWNAGSTGARMDRGVGGDFTIAGRGSNRNWHGKVASMVITTLRVDSDMPTSTEIEMMITDPKKWEGDYRVNQFVRWTNSASESGYTPGNQYIGYGAVNIWLMGDGGSDSYANGIRNEVYPSDQSHTKLRFDSMVSNDIETVSIPGL